MRDNAWEGLAAFHRRERHKKSLRNAARVVRWVLIGALAATVVGIAVTR